MRSLDHTERVHDIELPLPAVCRGRLRQVQVGYQSQELKRKLHIAQREADGLRKSLWEESVRSSGEAGRGLRLAKSRIRVVEAQVVGCFAGNDMRQPDCG